MKLSKEDQEFLVTLAREECHCFFDMNYIPYERNKCLNTAFCDSLDDQQVVNLCKLIKELHL